MDFVMQKMELLHGKENWDDWKYLMQIRLKGIPNAYDVISGKIELPEKPSDETKATEMKEYKMKMEKYNKTQSEVMFLLVSSLNKDVRAQVRNLEKPDEVWKELHSLFAEIEENKVYDICSEFFIYKWNQNLDMTGNLSAVKSLWGQLQEEIKKVQENKEVELPQILLICKIFEILPVEYSNFQTTWLMIHKDKARNLDNLTNWLCTEARKLMSRENDKANAALGLIAANKETKANLAQKNKKDNDKKKRFPCHYCHKKGHWIKECHKWIADGKPERKHEKKSLENECSKQATLTILSDCILQTQNTKTSHEWYVDSGATNHVTHCMEFLHDFEKFESPHPVTMANGQQTNAIGKGTVYMEANIDGVWNPVKLINVWYVPDLFTNLFSVLAALDLNANSKFESTCKGCTLFDSNGKPLITGHRSPGGGLFRLAVKIRKSVGLMTVMEGVTATDQLQLLHERFGHQSKSHVREIAKKVLNLNLKEDNEVCEGCAYGKMHRKQFKSRNEYRATAPGEIVHSDVCGPFLESIGGSKYFVLFKDDFTRYRSVYFIKTKSQVVEKFKQFLAEAKVAGHVICKLRCDGGGEFDNEEFRQVLQVNGIKQLITMPYTPQQNGSAERENRTIVECARSMMHAHGNLPQGLWAEMINTAAYILNRTAKSSVADKTPYELWLGKGSSIKHLRVIGTTCFVHVPKQRRHNKFDKKAMKCKLIGYDGDDGYRLWNSLKCSVIRSRDVKFLKEPINESKVNRSMSTDVEVPYLSENDESSAAVEPSVEIVPIKLSTEESDDESIAESEQEEENIVETRQLRDRSKVQQPVRFEDYVMSAFVKNTHFEPNTYMEAINCEDHLHWQKAMEDEISSLHMNTVWTLTELPKGHKAIPCKWVYKIKTNADGSIDKFKARLVVKGFSQKKGFDYNQTFSPVAKMPTIRSVIAVAANEGMTLTQFDVCTAFLYGDLHEEIYMLQPEGFSDKSQLVCRLNKSLYGLKQAPRCWNERVVTFLTKLGLKKSDDDPCLFTRINNGHKLIVVLYVDDGLIATTHDGELKSFLNELRTEFKIKSKPADYFLGLEISKSDDNIKLSQEGYVSRILERFSMENCRSAQTPIVKSGKEDNGSNETSFPYREAVGSLMYLMVSTRPDIAYAVSVVSRCLENPTTNDWCRVKRILRYLQGTKNCGIVYKKHIGRGVLNCYSDSDFGGDHETRRSTTGLLTLYAGGAISWISQRQSSVQLSTTGAEIVAASEAARDAIWLKRLLSSLTELPNVPVIHVDNEAAICLAQNLEHHRRTKHIEIKHFFIREQVTAGNLEVKKIDTSKQLADMFTKPLLGPRLQFLKQQIGLI